MSETNDKKRKGKGNWYKQQAKKRKFSLCPDLKGFLLFCNSHERETIREAYVLLNQFADRTYGPEVSEPKTLEGEPLSAENDEVENEIEDELDKEKKILQAQANKDESDRRFQVVESGIQNVLFIRTTVNDPVALASEILRDIAETSTQRSRYLIRLIPIQKTCKAFDGPVKEAAKTLLTPHYKSTDVAKESVKSEEGKDINVGTTSFPSYCVIFKARLNQNFFKQDAIDIIGDIMKELCPNAKVEYKNPDLAIVFEVMKGHCCLSVVPHYYKYKKYNLIELAASTPELLKTEIKHEKEAETEIKQETDKEETETEIKPEVNTNPKMIEACKI